MPFGCIVLEKSIRETDITRRDMLIVSTFPVPVIFSATPTYTHRVYTPTHTTNAKTHTYTHRDSYKHTLDLTIQIE